MLHGTVGFLNPLGSPVLSVCLSAAKWRITIVREHAAGACLICGRLALCLARRASVDTVAATSLQRFSLCLARWVCVDGLATPFLRRFSLCLARRAFVDAVAAASLRRLGQPAQAVSLLQTVF